MKSKQLIQMPKAVSILGLACLVKTGPFHSSESRVDSSSTGASHEGNEIYGSDTQRAGEMAMNIESLVYIAAPLYSEGEREYNVKLDDFLRRIGLTTYLPQRDGGYLEDLIGEGIPESRARRRLFARDIAALKRSAALLVVLDGRTVDEGACVELGFAFALGKPCFGYKTDPRSSIRGRDNLMIEGALLSVATTLEQLHQILAHHFETSIARPIRPRRARLEPR